MLDQSLLAQAVSLLDVLDDVSALDAQVACAK